MEENKIFNKESFISYAYKPETIDSNIITILTDDDNDDYLLREYEVIDEYREKKQEFSPQTVSNQKQQQGQSNNQQPSNQQPSNQQPSNQQPSNQQQTNQQQTNVLLCDICKGTFWSVSAYNLHWSCKNNLKCGYCCLYGHTISKCPSLNKPIKDIIE
jgi:hypothetical protein